MRQKTRIQGAILGYLIGDSLGTQYIKNPIPNPSSATISQLIARSYSYAGAMTLCTMSSINDFGGIDLDDIANKIHEWYIGSYLSPTITTDSNITISQSIRMYGNCMPADRCGSTKEISDNTALIRMLPIALYNLTESTENIIKQAHLVSSFTNNEIESKVMCALYCLLIKNILLEKTEKKTSLLLENYYKTNGMEKFATVLQKTKKQMMLYREGTDEVLDSFLSSWEIFNSSDDYESVIKKSIKLKNSCNTTACVSGSLFGAYMGVNNIPQRWLNQLDIPEEAQQVINQFLKIVINRF